MENEVAVWWGPDGVEDQNGEGGGEETKVGVRATGCVAEKQGGAEVRVEIQWIAWQEVKSCTGMRGASGAARVVFDREGATVARGGAADTVRGEAREMRVDE